MNPALLQCKKVLDKMTLRHELAGRDGAIAQGKLAMSGGRFSPAPEKAGDLEAIKAVGEAFVRLAQAINAVSDYLQERSREKGGKGNKEVKDLRADFDEVLSQAKKQRDDL